MFEIVTFAKFGKKNIESLKEKNKTAFTGDTAEEQLVNWNDFLLTFNASLEQRVSKLSHSLPLNEFKN